MAEMLYVNRAFEAMLGLEPGSCLGVSSADPLFEGRPADS